MTTFPSTDDIKKYILNSNAPVNKREIARDFDIKGDDRIQLKKVLKSLENDGIIDRDRSKSYKAAEALPAVTIIEVTGISDQGDVLAKPVKWEGSMPEPVIYLYQRKSRAQPPKTGDRVLARLKKVTNSEYEAHVIKLLNNDETGRLIGVFKAHPDGSGTLQPADKKERHTYYIPKDETKGAKSGFLVMAEPQPKGRHNKKEARIIECLGDQGDPKFVSLIAIHSHGIPCHFSEPVLKEAEKLGVPDLEDREDLTQTPLVTIDGADARDFDDAVFAEKIDGKNGEAYHLIVAIADVSFYVRPGTVLDKEAFNRGNSTYFPDRVVPMLPEALSNDVCSLRPHENRACLAAHLWIDGAGQLVRYEFTRALMKSAARLTYEQVQAARDGEKNELTDPLVDTIIAPLYDVFAILDEARRERGALELDLPERQTIIDDKGQVTEIIPRARLDSHKLIEEFMILANVAAAKALEKKNRACVYRVHDQPDSAKLNDTRNFLEQLGYSLPKGQVIKPKNLNAILSKAAGTDHSELVSTLILRTQARALYTTDNKGHFGLGLRHYAHFTSPIRRYADLIIHRLLVEAHGLGKGQYAPEDLSQLDQMCEHISETERRSMKAERSSMDRFTAQFLKNEVGTELKGHINGVSKFGLFVTLDDTGADGIVPMRKMPDDYYIHDERENALIGRKTGRLYRLCAPVTVRLIEADPLKGSTVLELVDDKGAEIPGFTPKKTRKHKKHWSNDKQDQDGGKKHSGRSAKHRKARKKKILKRNKKNKGIKQNTNATD